MGEFQVGMCVDQSRQQNRILVLNNPAIGKSAQNMVEPTDRGNPAGANSNSAIADRRMTDRQHPGGTMDYNRGLHNEFQAGV